jgi:hypothetical protein
MAAHEAQEPSNDDYRPAAPPPEPIEVAARTESAPEFEREHAGSLMSYGARVAAASAEADAALTETDSAITETGELETAPPLDPPMSEPERDGGDNQAY